MIRRFILLIVFMALQSAQAADWPWLRHCSGSPLICEVWFNGTTPIEGIDAQAGGVSLPVTYTAFGQIGSVGVMSVLVQHQGLQADQLATLKAGLGALLQASSEAEKLGLYAVAEGLLPLAAMGATRPELLGAVQGIPKQAAQEAGARSALSLVRILGGAPQQRRVLLWITGSRGLSESERSELAKALADEKVRLLVLQLQSSELDENSGAQLRALAQASGGIYQAARQSAWRDRLTALAGYSLNGGALRIDVGELCGAQNLRLQASPHDAISATQIPLALPACHPAPATPETPAVPEPEVSEPAPAPAPEPTSVPTPAPTVTESPTEPPESAPVSEAQGQIWPAYLAGGGLLLCLLVLLGLFLRRGKSNGGLRLASLREETSGRQHALTAAVLTLGRNRDCDLVFEDDTVSGKHALIRRGDNGQWRIVDTLSSNGVRLNGEPVDEATLSSGDLIQLGETRLVFEEG